MGLLEAMGILQRAFQTKAIEFQDILKMGRTQLQGAVPMALGQDCGAEVAKFTLRDNRRVYDLVLESGLLSKQLIDEILQPGILTSPRIPLPHH